MWEFSCSVYEKLKKPGQEPPHKHYWKFIIWLINSRMLTCFYIPTILRFSLIVDKFAILLSKILPFHKNDIIFFFCIFPKSCLCSLINRHFRISQAFFQLLRFRSFRSYYGTSGHVRSILWSIKHENERNWYWLHIWSLELRVLTSTYLPTSDHSKTIFRGWELCFAFKELLTCALKSLPSCIEAEVGALKLKKILFTWIRP